MSLTASGASFLRPSAVHPPPRRSQPWGRPSSPCLTVVVQLEQSQVGGLARERGVRKCHRNANATLEIQPAEKCICKNPLRETTPAARRAAWGRGGREEGKDLLTTQGSPGWPPAVTRELGPANGRARVSRVRGARSGQELHGSGQRREAALPPNAALCTFYPVL